jgi:patatin-related protein
VADVLGEHREAIVADAGGASTGTVEEHVLSAAVEHPSMSRELRIAPIVCGGTSLAVWIGGVTAELYRVVNCRDDTRHDDAIYRTLLDLTRTEALVDVVTGTSAGGLNGVLLSTAWVNRVPTSEVVGLRDLWMELGSILSLLRSPNEKDPPSLLRGDEYFWPRLTEVLMRLARAGRAQRSDLRRPVDLEVTVTTLSGELTRRTDDIGQELQETRQNHTLRFTTDDFGAGDDVTWARKLALASRTSASIPGVFEASYLPIGDGVRTRPGFRPDQASFSVGRWAVDGGVLANQPIAAARDRIIKQSVGRELRRVALFVNPTPTPPPPNVADDPDVAPMLAKVAASAYTAPRNIGIRHEIDDLREHNERVRRAVDVRRVIAQVAEALEPSGDHDPLISLASSVYDRFRDERAVLSVTSMLDRVLPGLGPDAPPRQEVEDALIHAVRTGDEWLPQAFDPDVGRDWVWGIAPLEYTAGMLLEIVRRMFTLPAVLPTGASGPGTDEAVVVLGSEDREELGAIRQAIHGATGRVQAIREDDREFWEQALRERAPDRHSWARRCYEAWPDPTRLGDEPSEPDGASTTETWEQLWLIATDLAAAAHRLITVHARVRAPERVPLEVAEELQAIEQLVSLLRTSDAQPATVVRRMVALHVIAVALGDTTRRHAPIELIEVSWLAPNEIDERRPEDKVAGIEFERLGAFVKRSWRANDWMWGRMDGSAQLVRLLLDPRRLRQLGVAPDRVLGLVEDLDVDQTIDADHRAEIAAELSFLGPEGFSRPVPTSVPSTTRAFTKLAQIQIAREELPEVYFAVLRSMAEGGGRGDGGDFCRAYEAATRTARLVELPSAEVIDLFHRCKVGTETAASEVGQDLLTRTAGRTALVAANAITGERSGLRWPSRVSRPFRQVALLAYALTQSATTTSKTGMAVTAVLSAVAGAIVAMFLLSGRTAVEINSGLVLLALLVLGVGLFLAILRSGVIASLPGFLALLVVALALIGDGMRQIVTGTIDPDPAVGWRHTVFLGSWPLVTIFLLLAGIGWAVSAISRALHARRKYRVELQHAEFRREPRPPIPSAPVLELIAVSVLIPAALVLHQPLLRYLLVGDDTGWRRWLIDASTWLGDRSVVMVAAGVAAFGVFFGLAWDRSFARLLRGGPTWIRHVVRARWARVVARVRRRGEAAREPSGAARRQDRATRLASVRCQVAFPFESARRQHRRRVAIAAALIAVAAIMILNAASSRMADEASSYAAMQLSGADLPSVLAQLEPVHRSVAQATLADVVFAAAVGLALVLWAGLLAERAALAAPRARTIGSQIGFGVAAWLFVGYAVFDLAENHLLLAALWRFDQGDVGLAGLGRFATASGLVKYGFLIAALLVPLVAASFGALVDRRFRGAADRNVSSQT